MKERFIFCNFGKRYQHYSMGMVSHRYGLPNKCNQFNKRLKKHASGIKKSDSEIQDTFSNSKSITL